ncbi:MAG: uroporphyrinogen decarboxylase family protein [Candidatus Hodarchaeota archaeon]
MQEVGWSMNAKERILTVLRREAPDIIPFSVYFETLQLAGLAVYEPWRKLLDKGLCLHVPLIAQMYKVNCPNAKMDIIHQYGNRTSWSPLDLLIALEEPHDIVGKITTPVGEITCKASLKSLDLLVQLPWFQEDGYLIKDIKDYEVIKYLIEDAEYVPNYDDFKELEMILGNFGIVDSLMPKSPLQSLIMLMGPKKLSLDYYMHQKEFDDLYRVIYKKQLEIYKIAAESPAKVIWAPDNVTSLITSPKLFERYNIPFYNEVADILHKYDKIYIVHMDGTLKNLVKLIAKTRIDVIESFTHPPVGDLTIREAKKLWKDKVIWANFPEPVSMQGQKAVRAKTIEMLNDAAPGDNFLMGISEGFPSFQHMLKFVPIILKTINKYGKYPITKNY